MGLVCASVCNSVIVSVSVSHQKVDAARQGEQTVDRVFSTQ